MPRIKTHTSRSTRNAQYLRRVRNRETVPERENRLLSSQLRMAEHRRTTIPKTKSAFFYSADCDYITNFKLSIGDMDKVCTFCNAKKWLKEPPAFCCLNGCVKIHECEPPDEIKILLENNNFLKNIRKYNGCFAMTSFGGKEIREENYMPTYKVHGQIYHRIGSLLPNNQRPQFLQIYFTSPDEQLSLRQDAFPTLNNNILEVLQRTLHQNNSYIKTFQTAKEQLLNDITNFKIVIHAEKHPHNQHPGRFNLPTASEIAVLMVDEGLGPRDIVLKLRDSSLQRISELHRAYDSLQYPLIFVRGEDGYHINIPQVNPVNGQISVNKKVSCMQFYSFKLMVKQNSYNALHRYGQLFNQFCVDMAAKMISERLIYIRSQQKKLRAENFIHLRDAINSDHNPNDIGQMIILPSTFTGSPRYLHERTQDALTYVRYYGRPDLFITFTCNPRWPEIMSQLFTGQLSDVRHDIVARVFNLKVKQLMNVITKNKVFGTVRCHMFTIEWQKRGLPHAHILIWLVDKIRPHEIDHIISAEIPNQIQDRELYNIICQNMIHGPCGVLNPSSPCMIRGVCSKKYPRSFLNRTQTGDDGYPKYRRRSPNDGGFTYTNISKGFVVDNRWVVPYCPLLSKSFNAHINVEFCHSVKAIKYICKYINKGSDAATFNIETSKDEVQNYINARYLSTSEAVWRIFGFAIHERYPSVVHLSVHLENGQRVYFSERNIQHIVENPPQTTLTAFFSLCRSDEFARTLLYHEVPAYYTWNNKQWSRRKRGNDVNGFPGVKRDFVLGRIYTIHPNYSECFYLRLLLHHVRGPRCFQDLKTINNEVLPTYRATCQRYGLLEHDNHLQLTLQEASISETSSRLRELFAIMLIFCEISNPLDLWNMYSSHLCEDILIQEKQSLNDPNLEFNENIFNKGLCEIENITYNIGNKHLKDVGLPTPIRTRDNVEDLFYLQETTYSENELQAILSENTNKLNAEQKLIFDEIVKCPEKVFFIDAPGGTGKTFLTSLILAKVRSMKKIAIAVASSGIAATLLSGGRTAHSIFKLPINLPLDECCVCGIKKNSAIAKVLQNASIIIWDECSLSNKLHIDAVNRTLQDIRSCNKLMGGLCFVFTGDFRQILPVVPRGTRADIVRMCITKSKVWQHVETRKLSINMRAQLSGGTHEFSESLIQIGNGSFPSINDYILINSSLGQTVNDIHELVQNVYPDVENNISKNDKTWLCERAIITTKNDEVDNINNLILEKIKSNERIYLAKDSTTETDQAVHFPTEFLNSLNPSGLPPYKLKLKVGIPIMLLRNVKPPSLCNGTRLQIKDLKENLITALILTGPAAGEIALIPRIPMIPSDLPFSFKRVQFPVRTCFAMTINKSQGQTFKINGVDLRNDVFTHGQLYVALSRSGSPSQQFILSPNSKQSLNIVFKEVFDKI